MTDVVPFPDPEERRRKLAAEVGEIQRRQAAAELHEMCETLHPMWARLFAFEMPPAPPSDLGLRVARAKVLAVAHMLHMAHGMLGDAGSALIDEEHAKFCLAQLRQPAAEPAEPAPAVGADV